LIVKPARQHEESAEAILKLLRCLGIDLNALSDIEKKSLISKASYLVSALRDCQVAKLNDALHLVSAECRLPMVLALELLFDVAKLCRDSYPPVKSVLREVRVRYKLVDERCLLAIRRAMFLMEC